jgi:hypothetical protein
MTDSLHRSGLATQTSRAELSDSLDIRFLVAGRLTPNAMQVRHDRVELAGVLGGSMRPDATDAVERDVERSSR